MGLRLRDGCGHPARLQAERVALRKGMIDCGSPSCAKGMAVPRCASWMIVPFIALKLPADYRIARLGSVRFPSRSAVS